MEIHLVMGHIDYEGSIVLGAYACKQDAEDVIRQSESYDKSRPKVPDIIDSDEEWDKYSKADDEWRSNHPINECQGWFDRYYVSTLSLIGQPTIQDQTNESP